MTAGEPSVWPAGHRAALVLAFAVDGEYGVIDAHGANAWSWRAQARYDLETGIWRVLELLRDYDVPATFCWVGRAAEDRPDAVRAAHADGHEIACHGWDHRGYAGRSLAEQRDDLRRTREALARISGAEPQGHLTPGRRFDEETPRALQDLGFRWSLDLMSGDLPSLAHPDPARDPVVQIPPTRLADDVSFFVRAAAAPRHALESWRDDLDVLRAEGKLMCLTLHPWVIGRPGASRALASFLDYAIDLGDVWLARPDHVALWWVERERERGQAAGPP